MKREIRTISGAQLRAKSAEKMGASGYAAVFNQAAELYSYGNYKLREVIKPGAFARAISEKQDVRCLMNHDSNMVLGRTKANTLTLSEDEQGLKFDCDFPDTSYARDLHAVMERGDLDQCSFGFMVTKQTWHEEKDGDVTIETREIEEVDLFDVSCVTYPAYEGTSCEARELRSLIPDLPKEIREKLKRGDSCDCDCPECEDDNCAECSNQDCDDPNCEGHERSQQPKGEQTEPSAEEKSRAAEQTEIQQRQDRMRVVNATI